MGNVKAKIQGSLLAKMLLGGLGSVLLLGIGWYGIGGMLRAREDRAVALQKAALEVEIAMLNVRRSEKDTLLRDVDTAVFYETGKSKYRGKHEKALAALYAKVDALRPWRGELGEKISSLEQHVNAYASAFENLMEARRKLGNGAHGFLGDLRREQLAIVAQVRDGHAEDVVQAIHRVEAKVATYLLTGGETNGRALRSAIEVTLASLRTGKAAEKPGPLLEALGKIQGDIALILPLETQIGLAEDKGLRGEMRRAIHTLSPLAGEIRVHADRLVVDARDTQHTAGLAVLIVGLLCASLVFFFYARAITRPMARLRDAAKLIGDGQLDTVVDVEANDEIGQLAGAFSLMAAGLRESKSERGRVFQGITETTSKLAAASSEILAATTQQSAGSEEQAAAVSQTVATIDEVLHAAQEGAARAKEVTEASRRSMDTSRAGTQALEETIERMRKVKDRSEELSAGILDLDSSTESIGVIIATVNDIAEQTNLLALNAAIEASRAGEQGKGFAVVAAEVRALADESKKATAQVRDLLGEIQRATRLAVTRTSASVEGANDAMAAAEQTGEAIHSLEEALSGQSQIAVQIDASASQQAIGLKQINEAMRSIDQVTRQNVDSNRQTERAMQDLSAMGDRLRRLVAASGQEA